MSRSGSIAPSLRIMPFDTEVEYAPGETLLQCIRKAGIPLAGDCGGRGTCGRCRVEYVEHFERVERVDHVERVDPGDVTREEEAWPAGSVVLACCEKPRGECCVTVPESSLEGALEVITAHGVAHHGSAHGTAHGTAHDSAREASWTAPRKPVVQCCTVDLSPPDLDDLRSDAERLIAALADRHGVNAELTDLAVLTAVPTRLRENNWTVNLAVCRGEIIAVERPGFVPLTLAVDIGTTTCAIYLLESTTGRQIDAIGRGNPQSPWGADVVTRLAAAVATEAGAALQEAIIQGINSAAGELCERNDRKREEIVLALFVGNTAMHHLFLGLPVEQLVNAPYVAAVTQEYTLRSRELGLRLAPGSLTRWLPNIAGYVGADLIAMILAAGAAHNRNNVLYLDIGTNTEMCLATEEQFYVLSAPSGPAFEGAHMEHGMRAAPGAIDTVAVAAPVLAAPGVAAPALATVALASAAPGVASAAPPFAYTTIGGEKARGLCGSGMLDLIWAARESGLIDWRGRLTGGELTLVSAEDAAHGRAITLTQRDVRQFQLAQGAIACGVLVLAGQAGIPLEAITRVVVAGAFGARINVAHAVSLGMLPVPRETPIEQIGNAAGAGACIAATDATAAETIRTLQDQIRYVELVTAPEFKTTFARATYFGAPGNGEKR